ncbi:MAG: rhomboid family intramembrane serine protease [Leptolyngbyaceae cyanobacterium MO_188.B28]|nr:rhomboid family intramembrane serine protease [Leptolyngbyaceae cyanobacterium MO_188.B28]
MTIEDPLQAKFEKLRAEVNAEGQPLSSSARDKANQGALTRWRGKFFLPVKILAIPWAQEVIDQVFFAGQWNLPVHPRSLDGVAGIFLSAFSHADFAHLIGNSIAFSIFSWLILAKSRKDYWTTVLLGWIGGGAACWLLGPTSAHGLSGVVYTLFGYLLAIGWLEKRFIPLLLSVFVLVNYSYFLLGAFPTEAGIAWWGHLFGFLLGMFSAYGVYREPGKSS